MTTPKWVHNRIQPIAVRDVPGRDHILFHPGNTAADTRGCILPGTRPGRMDGRRAVLESAAAMRATRPSPSSALLKMHVRTLRLNPTAARRPPYTMQARRLRLVPRD